MIYFVIAPSGCGHHMFHHACDIPVHNRLEQAVDISRKTKKEFTIKVTGDFKYLGSFPYDDPMNPIIRPDLFTIKEIGRQAKITNIYLFRDPWESTMSCYKRWSRRDDNIWSHADVQLDSLTYINAYMRVNEPDALVFYYRDICKFPENFEKITGMKLIKKSIKEAAPYDGDIKLIEFFKERQSLYQELIDNIVDLENVSIE